MRRLTSVFGYQVSNGYRRFSQNCAFWSRLTTFLRLMLCSDDTFTNLYSIFFCSHLFVSWKAWKSGWMRKGKAEMLIENRRLTLKLLDPKTVPDMNGPKCRTRYCFSKISLFFFAVPKKKENMTAVILFISENTQTYSMYCGEWAVSDCHISPSGESHQMIFWFVFVRDVDLLCRWYRCDGESGYRIYVLIISTI